MVVIDGGYVGDERSWWRWCCFLFVVVAAAAAVAAAVVVSRLVVDLVWVLGCYVNGLGSKILKGLNENEIRKPEKKTQ